jgi:hypothetical protein
MGDGEPPQSIKSEIAQGDPTGESNEAQWNRNEAVCGHDADSDRRCIFEYEGPKNDGDPRAQRSG